MTAQPLIRVGYDFLRNLGNFENVHVKVEIEDSRRDDETMDEAFHRIKTFAQTKLVEQVVEIEAELRSND